MKEKEIFIVLALERNIEVTFPNAVESCILDLSNWNGEGNGTIGLLPVFDSLQNAETYSNGRYTIVSATMPTKNDSLQ